MGDEGGGKGRRWWEREKEGIWLEEEEEGVLSVFLVLSLLVVAALDCR